MGLQQVASIAAILSFLFMVFRDWPLFLKRLDESRESINRIRFVLGCACMILGVISLAIDALFLSGITKLPYPRVSPMYASWLGMGLGFFLLSPGTSPRARVLVLIQAAVLVPASLLGFLLIFVLSP